MSLTQIPKTNPDEFSRCEERGRISDYRKSPGPIQRSDDTIKENIYHAFWKDSFLREMEYQEIDVNVENGVVFLSGHIVSATSQSRVENAIQDIPGVLGVNNKLVVDEKLTLEVAASLGELENTFGCKFFTGVSHGVVSLNGIVNNEKVKLLAEKCAARNSNVRGVINNVRVSTSRLELPDQPFLQPVIGELIYFLDGISAIVKQVIIDPNNRRVVAMTVQGRFANQQQELKSLNNNTARPAERILVLPISTVRYLTKVSGFLNIRSDEKKRYMEFESAYFFIPTEDWHAPYPYCPGDVLFAIEQKNTDNQDLQQFPRFPFAAITDNRLLNGQLIVNDSLGG